MEYDAKLKQQRIHAAPLRLPPMKMIPILSFLAYELPRKWLFMVSSNLTIHGLLSLWVGMATLCFMLEMIFHAWDKMRRLLFSSSSRRSSAQVHQGMQLARERQQDTLLKSSTDARHRKQGVKKNV